MRFGRIYNRKENDKDDVDQEMPGVQIGRYL